MDLSVFFLNLSNFGYNDLFKSILAFLGIILSVPYSSFNKFETISFTLDLLIMN